MPRSSHRAALTTIALAAALLLTPPAQAEPAVDLASFSFDLTEFLWTDLDNIELRLSYPKDFAAAHSLIVTFTPLTTDINGETKELVATVPFEPVRRRFQADTQKNELHLRPSREGEETLAKIQAFLQLWGQTVAEMGSDCCGGIGVSANYSGLTLCQRLVFGGDAHATGAINAVLLNTRTGHHIAESVITLDFGGPLEEPCLTVDRMVK
ncbi:MAG: hypothetical protein ACPGNV_12880 [Mangrovicoccus sp.]